MVVVVASVVAVALVDFVVVLFMVVAVVLATVVVVLDVNLGVGDDDEAKVISIGAAVVDVIAGVETVITSFSAGAFSICAPSMIALIDSWIRS